VEDSCEQGNEPSGFIKHCEVQSSCIIDGFSRRAQLRDISSLLNKIT
jgi:hypothetical protein